MRKQRSSLDSKLLLVRRAAIVVGLVATLIVIYALFQDVLEGVDTSATKGARLRGAQSDLGALLTYLVFACVGAYWAIRNWNRPHSEANAPTQRRRERRKSLTIEEMSEVTRQGWARDAAPKE